MTNGKEQQQQQQQQQGQHQSQRNIGVNPNPTMVSLTKDQELKAQLETATSQITILKSERDAISGTVNQLDREVAQLKDSYQAEQAKNERLLKQFEILYNMHEGLLEQCLNTATATAITNGKLSESIVKFKFIIPQVGSQE